jgi:type VI secretion system protein ImpA
MLGGRLPEIQESEMTREIELLLDPISADAPCGVDLEDSRLLAALDDFRTLDGKGPPQPVRIFGSDTPLPEKTPWREIREKSQEALAQSRDLRPLAHLGAALLRIEGLAAFCSALIVMDRWLTDRWDLVFPRVAEDALLRKNALNCFADRMAVVDGLRRAPIVSHRQLGSYSLRDIELATGQLKPTEADTRSPTTAQIEAALAATPVEELTAVAASVAGAGAALRNVIATMQSKAGFESAPDFDALLKPLTRIEKMLADHLPSRSVAGEVGAQSGEGEGTPVAVGAIKSRQDAVRAIDAAAMFFRKNEPSSPVPLLLDRAKRLVAKTFLEVLEDIAPDTLTEVKKIGGIKSE